MKINRIAQSVKGHWPMGNRKYGSEFTSSTSEKSWLTAMASQRPDDLIRPVTRTPIIIEN